MAVVKTDIGVVEKVMSVVKSDIDVVEKVMAVVERDIDVVEKVMSVAESDIDVVEKVMAVVESDIGVVEKVMSDGCLSHPTEKPPRIKAQNGGANMAQINPGGRVVMNHSTHIEGLIAVLDELAKAEGIRTITPAVISRANGHVPQLSLRVSVATRGGFKLIARRGKSVQEVFVVTPLDQVQLEIAVAQAIEKRA